MPTQDPASAYASALDQLLEVVVLMEGDMDAELTARGLTKARTHVLWELSRRRDPSQRDLADAVGVTPRTMTGLIDGLESTGFVVRRPHPTDRRALHIVLTAKGRDAADWLVSSHADLAVTLFGRMSPDRYACFTAGLGEVRDRLRAALDAAAVQGPTT